MKEGEVLAERYVVLELLGQGGMGSVYKVLDRAENRTVALKVLLRSPNNEKAIARFQREFEVMRALDHPNIVRAFDLTETEGAPPLLLGKAE